MPSPRPAGYSLTELLIVIGIIIAVAIVILIRAGGSQSLSAAEGDEVAAALRETRDRAVAESREHRLMLDHQTRHYWIERRGVPPESAAGFRRDLTTEARVDERLQLSVRVPAGDASGGTSLSLRGRLSPDTIDTVSFRPDGSATPREIELREPGGAGVLIRIEGPTGSVRVEPLAPPGP